MVVSPAPAQSMTEALDLPAPFIRQIRLLLVEDEDGEAERLRELLAAHEGVAFETTAVASLEAALRTLEEQGHDVVLLDLSLPEGAGLDVYLRARVAAASVPIVVMTTEREDFLARQALRLGAQDHLAKRGLGSEVLVRTLRHAVERHHMVRQLCLAREREHFLATHDSLTRLPNRFSFQDHLRRALTYAQRNELGLAVLFVDLDGFKTINDTLGHGTGDALLAEVAKRLTAATRRSDDLARVGGDEFVLTVQDADPVHGPSIVAEKVLDTLARPFRLGSGDCWITASVGIACFPQDGRDADTLIQSADLAMFHAKAEGRNRYRFYHPGMNAAATERYQRITSLREAIASGELVLHYQPQIDVALRAVVGAEALIRWQEPQRGLLAPAEFLPLAEESGVVLPMGEWALREACRAAVGWPRGAHGPLAVSVNVSARELVSRGFADSVASILQETGLAPGRLELEVAETSVLEHAEATRSCLGELRRLGVRAAGDRFGAGGASLALLKELPFDRLKIDPLLVRGASPGSPDETVVGALVELARRIGMEPVGEGVETVEQLRFLWARGCHQMQGFLFAKPAAGDELVTLLAEGAPAWETPLGELDD